MAIIELSHLVLNPILCLWLLNISSTLTGCGLIRGDMGTILINGRTLLTGCINLTGTDFDTCKISYIQIIFITEHNQ